MMANLVEIGERRQISEDRKEIRRRVLYVCSNTGLDFVWFNRNVHVYLLKRSNLVVFPISKEFDWSHHPGPG